MTILFDLDGTLAYIRRPIVPIVTRDMLEPLRGKCSMTIVTGSTRAELLEALQVCDITDFFDPTLCITRDEGCANKSTGESFSRALHSFSLPAVVIGDSDGDILGAAAAGVPSVRIQPTHSIEAAREELQRCIDAAVELL